MRVQVPIVAAVETGKHPCQRRLNQYSRAADIPVDSWADIMKLVTNQVTTASGNGRRSATRSDVDISPTCTNPTQDDDVGRNRHAW